MSDLPRRLSILAADADRVLLRSLSDRLTALGYLVRTGETRAAVAMQMAGKPDVVLVDEAFDSPELRADFKSRFLQMSSRGDDDALTLRKPIDWEHLATTLDRIARQLALTDTPTSPAEDYVGRDLKMLRIFDLVDQVADSRTTVLIVGESGTGKSLLARAIHQRSNRASKPFVDVACGSLPETLLESELFGHVRGAFTGAVADKVGRFSAADGGTIFLDEINSASPLMQVKLLRVLQEKQFEPVGSSQTKTVDTRIILATNAELEPLVRAGAFRQDLFYRVNVVTIRVPPLRERAEDIPVLADHFLDRFRAETGRQVLGFSTAALEALKAYAWPGNVRELENAIERAVVLTRKPRIELDDLPETLRQPTRAPETNLQSQSASPGVPPELPAMTLEAALAGPERQIIASALRRNAWSRQRTADELGIDRTTLYKKMKRLGLQTGDADPA
jgi:DNA-binding NtrC family response regulator